MQFCTDLVAGLADSGVTVVFISPGSRNTPLTLAVAREPRIRDINVRDERSAGFMAVGYAKATGIPAAVLCTSGSAATHYFPAVVEADQDGIPLIVLTADRPLHLRTTYAPQTMDQADLYGSHVKAFIDATDPSADGRALGARIAADAIDAIAGAIHCNVPLDEPLVPEELPEVPEPQPLDRPVVEYRGPTDTLEGLVGRRVLIVASGHQADGFAEALDTTARALGAPIIADPRTRVHGPSVIHHGDLLVSARRGDTRVLDALKPDIVLRLGPLPTSKPLWEWLAASGVEQILVHHSRLLDPLGSASTMIDADPTAFLEHNPAAQPTPADYLERWSMLDAVAGAASALAIEALPFPNEPEIARSLMAQTPAGSTLYVASSRPIRDLDAFGVGRPDVAVLANRGVNGIDGTISTAIGAALAGDPVALLIGDIAVLHDATALAEAAALGVPLRVITVNNDGGGIFSFLPQASSDQIETEVFERHWGTPHGLSLRNVAAALGMQARLTTDLGAFRAAVSKPIDGAELIELVTDRRSNIAHHETIRTAVSEALRGSDEVQ